MHFLYVVHPRGVGGSDAVCPDTDFIATDLGWLGETTLDGLSNYVKTTAIVIDIEQMSPVLCTNSLLK